MVIAICQVHSTYKIREWGKMDAKFLEPSRVGVPLRGEVGGGWSCIGGGNVHDDESK